MSRIGKAPIKVPAGVKISVLGKAIHAEGPKGKLLLNLHERITITKENDELILTRSSDSKTDKSLHGTSRALLNNIVVGVSTGWKRDLEIQGVGYRGEQKGKAVNLLLGFSHPILYQPPAGVTVRVDGNVKLAIEGADRQQVGQVAATIRGFRPPEPYKGKGVRYAGEKITLKEVKKT